MKNKKLIILSISIAVVAITSVAHAKKTYPAEIIGRALYYKGLGWLGHVAIATAHMGSAQGMLQNADQVIEILNEPTVGQINSIAHFKSRSKYWGSKYGIADRGERGYRVLVEANQQRWWCPTYTSDTDYLIGEGNPNTEQRIKCGRWRCDTYVWWAFYSQGWDVMPGRVWLPRILFNAFPYGNDERLAPDITALQADNTRSLDNVTAEELNAMSIEAFQMIMDNPPTAPMHDVTITQSAEMKFAYDEKLNDIKRGIMIDRLTSRGTEPEMTSKLINLYKETTNISVKEKVISGLMIHYQHHLDLNKDSREQQVLKNFFSELLYEKLTPKAVDNTIRGFVDLHTPEEVSSHLLQIDTLLATVNHTSSIMLKYALVHKSKELQPIYMQSIVNELRTANDSDLDSYLFGPLSIGYQGAGKNLLAPEAKQMVINYLKQVQHKYTSEGIKANPEDFHRNTTAPYYFELVKNMNL